MLTPPPDSKSKKADKDAPITAALKSAYHIMQQRIISNPQDMMGVLLYGTKGSKFYDEDEEGRGTLPYPHCYLYTDLDVPAAADVKDLRALAEDEDSGAEILIPSEEPVTMANVLFCANQIFTSKAANFSSRRLFIITDNDNPHQNEKALRSAATVRAKDLYDLGVIIELFPISRPGEEFDRSKFYAVRLPKCYMRFYIIFNPFNRTSSIRPLQLTRKLLHFRKLQPSLQPQVEMVSHF